MAMSRTPPSRFQIKQGKMSLAYPTLPDLGCLLMELDETGCKGSVLFQYVPVDVANAWRKILQPRRPLHVKIEVPPWLVNFETDGLVLNAMEISTHAEIEMTFTQLRPEQRSSVQQAVLALATQKVRSATVVDIPPAPPGISVVPRPPEGTALEGTEQAEKSGAMPATNNPFRSLGKPVKIAPVESELTIPPAPPPPPPQVKAPPPKVAPPPTVAPPPAHQVRVVPRPPAFPTSAPPPVPPPVPGERVAPPPSPANAEALRVATTMPAPPAAPATSLKDTSMLLKLKKIGEVLVHMGQLKPDQLDDALVQARNNNERLGRYLVRAGIVSAEVLCRALALQSGLPMTDLTEAEVPERLAKVFTHPTMLNHEFVPFDEAKTFVCVAAANPLKNTVITELETLCGKKVEVFIAEEEMVLKLLDSVHIKQQRKLRKHIRYEISVAIRYQFCSRLGTPAEPALHPGNTINISEGGMLIEGTPSAMGTPEELRRRGMCVSVYITPPAGGADIHAICQLRAIREKEKHAAAEPKWLLGVELVDMSAEDRRRLKEMCVKAVMGNQPKKPGRQPFL